MLPGKRFGTHKETYAVVACLYVIETEGADGRRGHPNVPDEKKPAELRVETVSRRFGITEKWIRKAYARIERWVRLGEFNPRASFDEYREEFPLEYEHRLTELWLEAAAE